MPCARPVRRHSRIERLEGRALLAAGALDPAFSGDGIAFANPAGATFVTEDVCLQADGKSVVVGNASNVPTVTRYNVDGSRDIVFGVNGFAQLPQMSFAAAVALQGDSIIVAGRASVGGDDGTRPAAARLTSTGEIDTGFGTAGYRIVDPPGSHSQAYDVVVQLDSKIVLAAQSSIGFPTPDNDFLAIRLTGNGGTDTPFGGGDGITEIDFTHGDDTPHAVALDYTVPANDPKYGSIFLVGTREGSGSSVAVAKLTPAGLLDNSFDGNGQLTTIIDAPSRTTNGRGAIVRPGSKLVVTGDIELGQGPTAPPLANFLTICYLANGALDTSFGPDATGYIETNIATTDVATSIATNYDGGLIVSGNSDGRIAMVAYTADGAIDTRFGGGDGIEHYTSTTLAAPKGRVETGNSVRVAVTGKAITPTRRIVATGSFNGHTIRVVDVAPLVTIAPFDPVGSENPNNTASIRITLSHVHAQTLRVRLNISGTAISPDDDRFTNDQDYDTDDVVFGAPFQTSYVDIPAGTISKTILLTPVNDTIVEADESVTYTLANNVAYDIGSPSSASIIIRDNEPQGAPYTVSSAFLYETLPLQARFTFSQDVGASLTIADFVFSAGLPTPTFSYSAGLNTATLSWAAALPDGNYNVRVKASGVTNAAGVHLNADHVNTFFALAGDANHDGKVDFDDLVVLAQHYNETGHTFSGGNFNYSTDGKVDFFDLVICAQQYNKSLSTLQAPVTLERMTQPTKRPRSMDEDTMGAILG